MGAVVPRPHPWDDAGCFAFDYLAGEDQAEPRRALVRAVKGGDRAAIERATRLLATSLGTGPVRLLAGADIASVHVPGHLPPAAGGVPALPGALMTLLPWLRRAQGRLVRHTGIRASATTPFRPTVAEHLSTLAWSGPAPPRTVIMVDDVFTHGCVTEACAQLLRDAGACEVIVLALARTRL